MDQSHLPRWGVGFPKHGGDCSLRPFPAPRADLHRAASPALPLPWPESDGAFGILSWSLSPHLQQLPVPAPPCVRSLPHPSSILLLGLACPWSRLQRVTVTSHSLELASRLSRSGRALGLSLCSPQALLSHQRAPFISKKTVFS